MVIVGRSDFYWLCSSFEGMNGYEPGGNYTYPALHFLKIIGGTVHEKIENNASRYVFSEARWVDTLTGGVQPQLLL